MSWYASVTAWSALIKLLEIDNINDNNNNNTFLQEWQVNDVGDLLQGSQIDDDKPDNDNENKVYLLLRE